jgi:hypothetical protein
MGSIVKLLGFDAAGVVAAQVGGHGADVEGAMWRAWIRPTAIFCPATMMTPVLLATNWTVTGSATRRGTVLSETLRLGASRLVLQPDFVTCGAGVRMNPAMGDRRRLRGRGPGPGQGWGGRAIAVRLVLAGIGQAAIVSGLSCPAFPGQGIPG